MILAFAIPAVVLVFAVVVIVSRGGGKSAGSEKFPLTAYMHDAETLRGNSYVLRGQIDSRLGYTEGKGAVIAVKTLESTGEGRVPVFVPEQAGRNLEVGQRFNIRVTVQIPSTPLSPKRWKKSDGTSVF